MKKILILNLFLTLITTIHAQHVRALAAYSGQNYEQAIELWKTELKTSNANHVLIHNYLGHSYAKLQNYSAAIAYYEKSLREDYNQSDTKFNIKVCRAKLNLDTENRVLFTTDWTKKIAYLIPYSILKWLIILFGLITLGVSIYLYFRFQPLLEKINPYLISIGLLLIGLYFLQNCFRTASGYSIISENTVGYENASLKGKSKAIHEGEKVEIEDEIGQNQLIKTEADLKYWIDKSVFYPI
jgi:tetratricopeptide (TPR) repeat protein